MSRRTLPARLTGVCLSAVFCCISEVEALMPQTSQEISIRYGWNAVYVEVAPGVTADELFADWPVNSVGLYDPASYLSTRQFSADWDSQGLPREAMSAWYRGVPEASSLKRVPAGSILMMFCTNNTFSVTLHGVPAAPRTTWHVTGTNAVHNLVGFSTTGSTDISAYLEGSPCANVQSVPCYYIVGDQSGEAPRSVRAGNKRVGDGQVLLLPSDEVSDWSGVLHVSPINGPYFSKDAVKTAMQVRNDGTKARTVTVRLESAENSGDLGAAFMRHLHVRDKDAAVTNAAWKSVAGWNDSWQKTLAAGETWNLEFGLDRTAFDNAQSGEVFGALLRITEDSGAHAKVIVPIAGETSGSAGSVWQAGLWVADVEFNRIISPGSDKETETGGTVKLRLPIHIDSHGTVRLLQRVVSAGETAADGTYSYHLYAGSATVPATANVAMRISAVSLPTESPVVQATAADIDAGTATFAFTVAGSGATSLLRHPLHPQHDGLRWDFKTAAPNGDDFKNYKGDVKPETFSVGNEITLTLELNGGEAAWNPEEKKGGKVRWKLSNLMRQGPITLVGDAAIKRISPQAELVLE